MAKSISWSASQIEDVINTFSIPCHPLVIEELEQEYQKTKPDMKEISTLITNDVSLTAGVLQISNNPAFREHAHHKEPFKTAEEAVSFLGPERTHKIVRTLVMRDKMDRHEQDHFDRFWDSATDVAVVSAYLAKKLLCVDPQDAYMLGLFRDCGIPILLQAIPEYKQILQYAETHPTKSMPQVEQEQCGINHQAVGYALCRKWRLPESIARAVLTFHDLEPPGEDINVINREKNMLISIVMIAELISDRFRQMEHSHMVGSHKESDQLPYIHPYCLGHLGISDQDFVELVDDTLDQMENLLNSHHC